MRWIAPSEKDVAAATLDDFLFDCLRDPELKSKFAAHAYPGASIEDESRWDEYLAWLSQRLVKMDQVLRPVVKGLP